MSKAVIGIIMGSDSDLPVMKDAAAVLESFNIGYEIKIISAHRTPELMADYAVQAHKNGIKVIIAGAGGAAHLPGMTASYTSLPVIGVPIESKSLKGIDSLLSIVQMPYGVPVATVSINNAKNAALLAVRILSAFDEELTAKLIDFRNKMAQESSDKNKGLADKIKGEK